MERNDSMEIATYQVTPEKHGDGTFFFTENVRKPTPLGVGWIAQKYKTMCM